MHAAADPFSVLVQHRQAHGTPHSYSFSYMANATREKVRGANDAASRKNNGRKRRDGRCQGL